MSNLVAIDIETTGLNHKTSNILCLAAYTEGKKAVYTNLIGIQNFFNNINKKGYKQGWWGGKFDAKHLIDKGIKGVSLDEDGLIMASLFKFQKKGLKDVAMKVLGIPDWSVNRKKMAEMDEKVRNEYCLQDAEVTYSLLLRLLSEVEKAGMSNYYSQVMRLYRLLRAVEQQGICIDSEVLDRERTSIIGQLCEFERAFRSTFRTVLDDLEEQLKEEAYTKIKVKTPAAIAKHRAKIAESLQFNFNSPPQRLKLLSNIGIHATDKKGKETTNSKALKFYIDKHPIVMELIKHSKLETTSHFLTSWQEKAVNGVIYGTYNVHTVDTGRLSSSEPNLQQVPKESSLRSIFKADKGKVLVIADYAQIEPRIMAHLTKDPELIQVFRDGIDIYAYLACSVLGCTCPPIEVKERYPETRNVAKALTLAIMYGMGAKALAYHLTVEQGIPTSKDTARSYIRAFYSRFKQVEQYKLTIGYEAYKNGFIKGIHGRRLWLPKAEAEHKAFNYINQNAASELCAFSQLVVTERLKDIAQLKLLTHDEVCYECDPLDAKRVIDVLNEEMVDKYAKIIKVPLELDIFVGPTWGAKQ